jgi:hypothetical protein
MLDYAPDTVIGNAAAVDSRWTIAWAGEGLPDESVLLDFIAASRQAGSRATRIGFEPERVAGYCAAG